MLESIRLQLERLGINVQKDTEFQFERDGSTIRIPAETYGFVSSMENSNKTFYFDRWDDGLDSLYIMNTALTSDCIEYRCLEKHPYFSFMSNHSHSYYVIRADDKNPANPAV
ncbi:MAG: hypothetical protein GY757_13730, partial [bacterium]|nr:hypothetical protein [bacterium]